MGLKVGFDLDGVLADFTLAFRLAEERLYGPTPSERESPEGENDAEASQRQPTGTTTTPHDMRSSAVWKYIRSTPDFWTTVKPTDEGAVRRLYDLMIGHRWEVVFMTQRPSTRGDTVQRQSQRWLVDQGFEMPSVFVIDGSRGAAAEALRLDYHVDDSTRHCLDVIAESRSKPILIVGANDPAERAARNLGIGVAHSIGECLDILEEASTAGQPRGALERLAARIGWKKAPSPPKRQRAAR